MKRKSISEEEKRKKAKIIKDKRRDKNSGEMATLNSEEETIFNTLKERYGLNGQVANILARDRKLLGFFNETVEELNAPITIANLVNE